MRFILGVVLAGVVMFMWGFVFWTLMPFPKSIIKPVPAEAAVSLALSTGLPESGVYLAPYGVGETDEEKTEAYIAAHEKGPVYMTFYSAEGKPAPMNRLHFGVIHSLVVAFIGGLLCIAAAPRSYMNRVMLIFWATMFGTVWSHVGDVIWWNHPWNYCGLQIAYHVGGGLLMGLILAAFIRPAPEME